MGMKVDHEKQVAAANDVITALGAEFSGEGLTCELRMHAGGKQQRSYVYLECPPSIWLIVAETCCIRSCCSSSVKISAKSSIFTAFS